MANCRDCIHNDVCVARITADENYPERHYTENNNCSNFKDRNKFIELPCKVGDTVYGFFYPGRDTILVAPEKVENILIETEDEYYLFDDFGKKIFLTEEEAQNTLNALKVISDEINKC